MTPGETPPAKGPTPGEAPPTCGSTSQVATPTKELTSQMAPPTKEPTLRVAPTLEKPTLRLAPTTSGAELQAAFPADGPMLPMALPTDGVTTLKTPPVSSAMAPLSMGEERIGTTVISRKRSTSPPTLPLSQHPANIVCDEQTAPAVSGLLKNKLRNLFIYKKSENPKENSSKNKSCRKKEELSYSQIKKVNRKKFINADDAFSLRTKTKYATINFLNRISAIIPIGGFKSCSHKLFLLFSPEDELENFKKSRLGDLASEINEKGYFIFGVKGYCFVPSCSIFRKGGRCQTDHHLQVLLDDIDKHQYLKKEGIVSKFDLRRNFPKVANNLDIKDLSIIERLFSVPRLDEWSKNMQVEGIETTDEWTPLKFSFHIRT